MAVYKVKIKMSNYYECTVQAGSKPKAEKEAAKECMNSVGFQYDDHEFVEVKKVK